MPSRPSDGLISKLRENCSLGRKLVIVIGSGISRGVGAPGMEDIHTFLENRLRKECGGEPVKNILALLSALVPTLPGRSGAPSENPRSILVRLYHLLQSSEDRVISAVWREFGSALVSGKLDSKSKALWTLDPATGHFWAARLACAGRAIIISLNYDGLTQRAIDLVARAPADKHVGRILSTPNDILKFFVDVPAPDEFPVPLVKFRGDVFHAVCRAPRCPERGQRAPLYDLLDRLRRRIAESSSQSEDSSIPPSSVNEGHATAPDFEAKLLDCPVCGQERQLEISFPGVFGKEESIGLAMNAFHRMVGSSIGGIAFLGFSGVWDEALVEYLVRRASQIGAPVFSASMSETPHIGRAVRAFGSNCIYEHIVYKADCGDARTADSVLDVALDSINPNIEPPRFPALIPPTGTPLDFPAAAFIGLGVEDTRPCDKATRTFTLPGGRELEVRPSDASIGIDSFTGIAGHAAITTELRRLDGCTQLGVKSVFLREPLGKYHRRFDHSMTTGLLAMVWFECLRECWPRAPRWPLSGEAKLALELAALFHDARHLPFSHMMEDVFAELHWEYAPPCDPLSDPAFGTILEKTLSQLDGQAARDRWGFWSSCVHPIQTGRTGFPCLDAIVDSAIDVDKIEYVFHDSRLTGQNVRLADIQSWMSDFLSGQSVTPEGLIRLEGQSPIAAIALLEERMHLYRRVYLAPELRGLETLVKYIVTTWLKWKVPEKMDLARADANGDWRSLKGEMAGELLWGKFPPVSAGTPENELMIVKVMVDELKGMKDAKGQPPLDKAAIEWIGKLWDIVEPFTRPAGSDKDSRNGARDQYSKLAPVGPVYALGSAEDKIRRVVRRWRVHSPLLGIIDVARFPKFLSTPRDRKLRSIGPRRVFAEQFLVPSKNPSEWRITGKAKVPLHLCDFTSFELPVIQILILDPWGPSSGGSPFLHEMVRKELRDAGVELYETPERAARSARLAGRDGRRR